MNIVDILRDAQKEAFSDPAIARVSINDGNTKYYRIGYDADGDIISQFVCPKNSLNGVVRLEFVTPGMINIRFYHPIGNSFVKREHNIACLTAQGAKRHEALVETVRQREKVFREKAQQEWQVHGLVYRLFHDKDNFIHERMCRMNGEHYLQQN
jgi:hypothetical protein